MPLLYLTLLQAAPEQISIQFKWKHSFQFAGYYAALEKGYYQDAGLNVALKEIDFSRDFVEQVLAGESEYGVSDSTLLLYHLRGKSVVLINQIFQHSPLVFLTHRGSGILSPYEMAGKKIALNASNEADASLIVLLTMMLGDLNKINLVPFDNSSYQDFAEGKIDVISAYSTSEPYLMLEQGVDINIINPQQYGIDFYGDNFYTTRKELEKNPERVEKMSQATLKGWQYALAHPDEIIQLIRKKYTQSLSVAHLQYEARSIRQIIIPELIALGTFEQRRYSQVAEAYHRLGLSDSSKIQDSFYYKQMRQNNAQVSLTQKELDWVKAHPQIIVGGESDWAPFDFVDSNGRYSGIANDYLKLIAQKTGLKFKVVIDQWSHLLQKIRDRQIDLLPAAYYTDDRSHFVNYSDPYFTALDYFFIRDDLDVKSMQDLNGKRVAMPKDFALGEMIKKYFPEIKIITVDNLGSAIDAVLENQADMLFDNYASLTYVLKKEGINNIIPFKSTRGIVKNYIHIITRKNAPELASIIQKGLDAISENEKRLIYSKWLERQPEEKKQQLKLSIEQQRWLNNHSQIRLGVDSNWPPYEFINQSGQLQGISADILSLIEKKLGIQFKIVSQYSWAEMLEKAESKDIDMLSSITQTADRKLYLNFTDPIFTPLISIYTRKDTIDIFSINDLRNKKVVIENNYFLHELLTKEHPQIQLLPVETTLDALKALSYGKADAYVGNQGAANWIAERNGINNLKLMPETQLGKAPLRLAVRKDWAIFQSLLNKALADISSAELSTIRRKWMGNDFASKRLSFSVTEQQWLKTHPLIRLGVESNWPPFEFIDQSGALQGLSADVLKLMQQRLGIQFKVISKYNWAETFEKGKRNEVDIISSIAQTAKRGQYFNFTDSYYTPPTAIFTRKNSSDISGLSDLKYKTVAIENQYYLHQLMLDEYPEIKLFPVENTTDALKALSHGKVDAYVGNQGAATWLAEQNALTNLQVAHDAGIGKVPLRYAVRKDWPVLQGLINKVLASISKSEMSSIRRKWMGLDSKTIKFPLSDAEQQWLDRHKTIRFGGDPDWLPYEAFDNQGNYIGIVAEHLKLIEQKLGIKIDIIPTQTWSETIAKVKNGEIDVLSEATDSFLKTQLKFTQAYLSSPVVIVMKKDEAYVENIEQIKQKKIAVVKEYGYVPEILKKHPDLGFYDVASVRDGLTAVSTGKVDAFLATMAQASYNIAELGINNIRIVGTTEFNTQLAFAMREEFAPLVPLFNRALDAISQGEKKRILDIWGKDEIATKIDYQLLAKIAGMLLLVIAVFIYWNRKLAKEIERRHEAETQTQTLLDNIPLQVVVTSFEGKILSANPQALKDYKINREEINQFNIQEFYNDINDREIISREITEKGRVDQKIVVFKKQDGTVSSMMISIMPINYNKTNALLTIAVDMTDRLEMEAALQVAKEEAEAANHAKSEFLSNMSHEIRTPMNAIIGFTELLNDQVKEPKLKAFVKTIQSAGHNLLALINDILDLSKIEAGKFQIEKAPCNPHELFTELGNIFMMKMREKNIDFILDVDPVIPESLLLDSTRLRQVLFNLVGNAVKFTEQGFVRLKARTDNEDPVRSTLNLLIDVEDSGIGITEDQQQLIFQEFEQSKGQDVKKYGGTGLGLSISKRLIELMDGKISVKSQPGEGSTFTITLENVNVASLVVEQGSNNANKPILFNFYPAKILVVDDVEDNRSLLLANFEGTELRVVEAKNGLEAVELAQQQTFDLILMDIRMPVMDGYQAAKEIHTFSDLPIIALTASVMSDEFERLKSNDFQGYLRKPVLKKDLMKELSRFLPFEESIETRKIDSQEELSKLSDEELGFLPDLLLLLNPLVPQCEKITKSNNIAEIQAFVDAIIETQQHYPVAIVNEFSTQLNRYIECFDIAKISRSVKIYPQLIIQLEQIKNEHAG